MRARMRTQLDMECVRDQVSDELDDIKSRGVPLVYLKNHKIIEVVEITSILREKTNELNISELFAEK